MGTGKPQTHLISEANWALWKNRCSNVYEESLNGQVGVLKFLYYRLRLISKVDRFLLSIRVYYKRWLGLNQAIHALDNINQF